MKTLYLCFLSLGLLSIPTVYAQPEPGFPENILGKWEGTGQLFGQEATFSMKWESPLGGQFLSLEFSNRFKDSSGMERAMDARAYYNLRTNKGYWFDSRGQTLPLLFEIGETTMTVFWGEEATEKGKTIYTLHPSGAKAEDFVYKGTDYVSFGNAEYLKAR